MNQSTNNLHERRMQKKLLRRLYSDYDPKRHDAFVIRYNADREREAILAYMRARGIEKE